MNLSVKKHVPLGTGFSKNDWLHGALRDLTTKASLMRITLIALLLSLSGLLLAREGRGQDLDKVIVTVEIRNVSLKSALRKIEGLTKMPFTYKTNDVSPYRNISYEGKEVSLAKVLDELLKGTDLGFEQVNSNIVIKKNSTVTVRTIMEIEKPDGSIRGKVTDENGNQVANASISIASVQIGVVANANGEFTINNLAAGTYTIVVSAVGFDAVTQQVTVGDNATAQVNIQMKSKENSLSEVVVTALGISRKERSLGYSTQQVKGDNLTLTKEQNVLGSLAGKIAGVQVTGSSGASMGGTQKIKIRGVNSIAGTDQPLIVVDGTPISNANFAGSDKADFGNLGQDVNPEDIESVNVLKGPAASALYGIRGQYGVIMITTKKGKKGAKRVDVQVNSAFSVERAGNFFPLQ